MADNGVMAVKQTTLLAYLLSSLASRLSRFLPQRSLDDGVQHQVLLQVQLA